MTRKMTIAFFAFLFIFAISPANSYPQTSTAPQNPKAEGLRERDGLNLTEDQKTELKSIHQSARARLLALRSDNSLSPDQKQANARSIREATREQVLRVLTPQQQEIMKTRQEAGLGHGRARGSGGGEGRGVGLDLTEDQKAQLRSLRENTRHQINSVHSDSNLSQEQKIERIRAIHQDTRQQMSSILTPEQLDKLRAHRRHRGVRGLFMRHTGPLACPGEKL